MDAGADCLMQFKQRTISIRLRGAGRLPLTAVRLPPAFLKSPKKNLREEIKRLVITERPFNKPGLTARTNQGLKNNNNQGRESAGTSPYDITFF